MPWATSMRSTILVANLGMICHACCSTQTRKLDLVISRLVLPSDGGSSVFQDDLPTDPGQRWRLAAVGKHRLPLWGAPPPPTGGLTRLLGDEPTMVFSEDVQLTERLGAGDRRMVLEEQCVA